MTSVPVELAPDVATLGAAAPLIDFSMTAGAFRRDYFEQKFCLLRGALKDRSFEWGDVDEILHRVDPTPPLFTIFKDGAVPPERYIEPRDGRPSLDKARFYELLQNGASVVMNRLEDASLAAQRLCQAIGRFTGHTTTSNAYLSFGGTGTFGRHWDTHDVFVVQLLGKKRWQVFAPTWRNPLSFQTSGGHEHLCPNEPLLDCELEPGDVLYLPRGFWHRVIPGNSGSFHLSVGSYAPTAMDLLQWICNAHLSQLETARVGLHFGPDKTALNVENIVGKFIAVLRDPNQLAAFERSFKARERLRGEFDLAALAGDGAEWPDDATLHLNSAYPIEFQGPHLIVNGNELRLEPLRRSIVMILSKSQATSLRSLYASIPTAPRAAIRAALFDLAQHDILTLHHSESGGVRLGARVS